VFVAVEICAPRFVAARAAAPGRRTRCPRESANLDDEASDRHIRVTIARREISPEARIPDRSAERGALIADIAGIVTRSHDLRETLDNVTDLVAKRLDADVCSVYLTSADRAALTLSATMGLDKASVGIVKLAVGEGLVGHVAQRGEAEAFAEAQKHPAYRYFPETKEEQFASLAAAPLKVRGLSGEGFTIGVLVVQTRDARVFSEPEVELLETCAQLIAPVVMNAQLLSVVAGGEERRSRLIQEIGGPATAKPQPAVQGRAERNAVLKGIATSRGIAIGPVYFLGDAIDLKQVDYAPNKDAAQEQRDLENALEEARRELQDLREDVIQRFGPDFAAVFHTHIQILEDKGFVQKLQKELARSGNALESLTRVLAEYERMFGALDDPYFRERGIDIQDVGQRVVARLLGVRHNDQQLTEGAIVVAAALLPAHFATLDVEKVAAVVSEHGGPTSHGAIFARALEIPAVTGVAGVLEASRAGELAIVDGDAGRLILNPDDETRSAYARAQQRALVAVEHLDALAERPAETRDGHRVRLTANAGLLSDLRLVERHGAEGIGLFRTELLALVHRGFPTEEEQEKLYEQVAATMKPRPVTIRTLDLGGDKAIPQLEAELEANPQLGWRSIRLSLSHLDAFRAQLRAILRASAHGNVSVLIPMVSAVEEIRRVRELVEETKRELAAADVPFDPSIPVGVMIEVPAAAVIADVLARECDFFSIGTNDLTQYTLAVDRGNERVAYLYDPLHPAVLALIDRSVRAARKAGIGISLCGEMASNPLAVPILVGLGLEELSGVASAVPLVKEIVRALDSAAVADDARRALEAATVSEVRAIAAARLVQAGLLDHPDLGEFLRSAVQGATVNGARGA
jgi:phosphotransferase system enzyme I (PtsP)